MASSPIEDPTCSPAALNLHNTYDTILILDFGSQYTHIIARRIRELGAYSEILPCTVQLKSLTFIPKGIVLSGGPNSVFAEGAPHAHPSIWDSKIPILGICYGLQEIAWHFGGTVSPGTHREFGHANLQLSPISGRLNMNASLLKGINENSSVWMSHGDQISDMPEVFETIATTPTAPHAAIAHHGKHIYGLQFHPEVTHTEQGKLILENFVLEICGCSEPRWTMGSFIDLEIERIRALVPEGVHVIGALSGGVDSTVAGKIMFEAIGDRFHAIFVDNGLLRSGEREQVQKSLREDLKIPLIVVDAKDRFLSKLIGISDPEKKRKIIGNTFIEVFEEEAAKIDDDIRFLLQGTLYPDVIESISATGGPSVMIKTHHNVGGLLKDMKFDVIEPLRELFKDEVRLLGKLLGISPELLGRHPFPGPGLAIRCLGEVTEGQLIMLREADRIFLEEIRAANLYNRIGQAFSVILPIRTVGVMGDGRTYDQVVCLRAVETSDFMTADWFSFPDWFLKKCSSKIINEVKGVNRVVYDISSKPPSTIEWE